MSITPDRAELLDLLAAVAKRSAELIRAGDTSKRSHADHLLTAIAADVFDNLDWHDELEDTRDQMGAATACQLGGCHPDWCDHADALNDEAKTRALNEAMQVVLGRSLPQPKPDYAALAEADARRAADIARVIDSIFHRSIGGLAA